MNEIKVINVGKSFKKVELLRNININFESGKIYGVIGTNGCGKSVFLKILCGLSKPTSGEIIYNGKVVGSDLRVLPNAGIIINKPSFFDELTAYQNLDILARLRNKIGEKEINEALKTVDLPNDKKPVSKFSLGMKQRLGIAQAIMENVDILILDEPTNALDEGGVEMLYAVLKKEAQSDKIIIITSHNKNDINTLCDHVYRIKEGALMYEK